MTIDFTFCKENDKGCESGQSAMKSQLIRALASQPESSKVYLFTTWFTSTPYGTPPRPPPPPPPPRHESLPLNNSHLAITANF